VRSRNAMPSAKVMVAVVSEKPRTVERDIYTSPLAEAFCRLLDALGYYPKHPFQAIGFAGSDESEVGAGTIVSGPFVEALFRLVGQATDSAGLRSSDGPFNPGGWQFGPFVPTPGPPTPEGHLLLGEAPNAQHERCHVVAERSHFNKSFASLNASCLLRRKGHKDGRFASLKTLLRPGQGRPKHCLGETYADHFFTALRCTNGGFLLGFACVARGKSCKVGSPCYE
jgi:hypothetical protein